MARRLGKEYMPWQRHIADVAGEVDPETGRLWYREIVITVPRQSGKTTLIMSVFTHRCVGFPTRQRCTYMAQTRQKAREKWEDEHIPILDASIFGKKGMYRPRLTNGQEALKWVNGSMWGIEANTESAGHGPTLDLGCIDEAFKHIDHRSEQAMKPAMITRPEPQLWVVSTAGTPNSTYLWGKVEAGRPRVELGDPSSRIAYFEWSAADDEDPSDPATWWRCMPALGWTIDEAAVAAEFDSMKLADFERAFLNRWTATRTEPVIPVEDWEACGDEAHRASGRLCWSLDVSADRSSAAISVSDGTHIEVVEHRDGVGWAVDRAVELDGRHGGVWAVDAAGPAGSLIPDMQEARLQVHAMTARECAQAAAGLYDAVQNREVRHIVQTELEMSLAGVVRRRIGDSWQWSRSGSTSDPTPVTSVTFARWAANNSELAPKRRELVW